MRSEIEKTTFRSVMLTFFERLNVDLPRNILGKFIEDI
jgi:hypothetical protein